MGSPHGSTFSTNVTELTNQSLKSNGDSSTPPRVFIMDKCPVYVKELIAGGAAGGFAKTAVAPLERIKILFQTRSEGFHSLGMFHSMKKLWEHEGVLGFYKGNGASVLRIVPYAALHFMTYEQYRCWILNNVNSLGTGPVVDLLAGSAAGGTAVLCTYPLDLARTKLAYQEKNAPFFENGIKSLDGDIVKAAIDNIELNNIYWHPQVEYRSGCAGILTPPAYNGIKDVFQKVYIEGGMRSLYRGVGPTLIGILPYAGLKFYVYEELKRHVPDEYQKSVVMRLSCGAIAGLLGQTFTYPLDVVRRQMQVQSLPSSSEAINSGYRSTVEGLKTITRNQGWRQLFAGLSINYVKVVPSVAIGFTTYDMMKVWLGVPPRERTRSVNA